MEHPKQFHKILQQIMSREPKPQMSEEEIHFDVLAMKVMQLVGDRWVTGGWCVWIDPCGKHILKIITILRERVFWNQKGELRKAPRQEFS